MSREERIELIRAIESLRGSRVICCLTSDRINAPGMIAKDFIPIFYTHLSRLAPVAKLDLFFLTTGGDTLAAFGISRLLREFATRVSVLIPEKCHSAGTLLALGANEIFMTPAATLTPIDPSIVTPLNPKAEGAAPGIQSQPLPVSVESIGGFYDLIKDEWKLDDEGKAQAFGILARRVHPLVLGQAFRARQQIMRLAEVLLIRHRTDKADKANIQNIVEQLTRKLGSHDYLISRQEAREILGTQVTNDDPEQKLEKAVWKLYESYRDEMQLGRIYDPAALLQQTISQGRRPPVTITNRLVTIETTTAADVWQTEMQLQAPQSPQLPVPVQGAIQQLVLFNGWRHYE
jgi:hypothetical protein